MRPSSSLFIELKPVSEFESSALCFDNRLSVDGKYVPYGITVLCTVSDACLWCAGGLVNDSGLLGKLRAHDWMGFACGICTEVVEEVR